MGNVVQAHSQSVTNIQVGQEFAPIPEIKKGSQCSCAKHRAQIILVGIRGAKNIVTLFPKMSLTFPYHNAI